MGADAQICYLHLKEKGGATQIKRQLQCSTLNFLLRVAFSLEILLRKKNNTSLWLVLMVLMLGALRNQLLFKSANGSRKGMGF